MKKDKRVNSSLFSVWQFLIFWGFAAFIVSCCMIVFLADAGVSHGVIKERAPRVFFNILFLSVMFTIVDSIRRHYTVKRPIQNILVVTEQIRKGNFSVRIPVTRKKTHYNEFDIIVEDLNAMIEELAGIETLRTDFIANVSHELKTPLAVLQNYAVLLQDPELSEEKRKEYTVTLSEASRRLSALITNILKMNKLDNQTIYPEMKKYDLGEQLCECLLSFEDLWEKKS